MKILNTLINHISLGEAQKLGRLTIMPVLGNTDFALPFLTLEEAIAEGFFEIVEKDEAGDVSEILVKNRGKRDVIIIEGEELIGSKQNRIVNTTTIVPSESEVVLPVTCVEQGRWNYVSDRFAAAERVIHPSLRKESNEAVAFSLKSVAGYDSDQSAVWKSVRQKGERMGVNSPSGASSDMSDEVLKSVVSAPLEKAFEHVENQIGFLAFIDGGFAGGDIFGSAGLCKKQMRKLTRGYFVDAADLGITFPNLDAEELLADVAYAIEDEYPAVGKGREIRFEGKSIRGACKINDEELAHLTVFPR